MLRGPRNVTLRPAPAPPRPRADGYHEAVTSASLHQPVTVDAWMAAVDRYGFAEVVDGRLVIVDEQERASVTDNRHDVVARRLANALEAAWGLPTSAPARWQLRGREGSVVTGRVPDVLVGDDTFLQPGPFVGHPILVGEVWSPSNTFGEITRKRREYYEAGAQAMVEAWVDDTGTVLMSWFTRVPSPQRWLLHASAAGPTELVVELPRPFRAFPDHLLRLPTPR